MLCFQILKNCGNFVLNLFLFLAKFQPKCSYKIVLIKKKECIYTYTHIHCIILIVSNIITLTGVVRMMEYLYLLVNSRRHDTSH